MSVCLTRPNQNKSLKTPCSGVHLLFHLLSPSTLAFAFMSILCSEDEASVCLSSCFLSRATTHCCAGCTQQPVSADFQTDPRSSLWPSHLPNSIPPWNPSRHICRPHASETEGRSLLRQLLLSLHWVDPPSTGKAERCAPLPPQPLCLWCSHLHPLHPHSHPHLH